VHNQIAQHGYYESYFSKAFHEFYGALRRIVFSAPASRVYSKKMRHCTKGLAAYAKQRYYKIKLLSIKEQT